MKFYTPIEISGVQRVVINRTQVWDRQYIGGDLNVDNQGFFVKIGGGPGFTKRKMMSTNAMARKIHTLLRNRDGYIYLYRAWFSEGTLNVVRNEVT